MLRQHHTPAWIYLGGLTLTLTAGVINAIGLLGVHHQALSHMSGAVTTVGMELGRANYAIALHVCVILAAFFSGSLVSGAVIRQSSLRLGRRYGVALSLESVALFAAVYFFRRGTYVGDYAAAMACGLQNAMVSTYSGSTMRTTHMTGMLTDLGIACGHFVRGDKVDWHKFRLYGVLFLGFFAGGVIGAIGYGQIGYDMLLVPAVLSGAAGLGYATYRHYQRIKHGIRDQVPYPTPPQG